MKKIVLLRHAESKWNSDNKYTGWIDIELSEKGKNDARQIGHYFREEGYDFDIVFTSMLKRTIQTAWLVLESLDRLWIPIEKTWQLNERHFGSFQGKNKTDLEKEFGKEYIKSLKENFSLKAPSLEPELNAMLDKDGRYKHRGLSNIPTTESLSETYNRIIPYWTSTILPQIREKNVLIVSHGNILRLLIMHIKSLNEKEAMQIEIPTGKPIIIEFE